MEGLHAVGGVILVEKISIIHVFNFMLCIPEIIESYHVFRCVYELLYILSESVW
jgi:hypothetical protein